MVLSKYLLKCGCVTGPLVKNSSYSHLDRVKRSLLCIPQFMGNEDFLLFGNALHERFLEDRFDAYNKLSMELRLKVDKMVAKLRANPVVAELFRNSVREKKVYGHLHGVELAFILDLHQPKLLVGSDLKTTMAKNYHDCIAKAISYGYPKQAYIYKKLAKIRKFFFIFIQKEAPFHIHIIDSDVFKIQEAYVEQELKFLLYFYKTYGNINIEL